MPIQNFDLNKISQILSPIFQSMGQQQTQQPNQNDDQLNQAMMQMLTPKDEQYDKFAQMLNMIPQRDQFEPTKGRRIASALMGLGTASPLGIASGHPIGFKSDIPSSLKVQQSVLDEPYNKALENWKTSASPTLEAAKLENTRNVNSRIAGTSLKTADLREKGIQNTLSRNETLKQQGDKRLELQAEENKIKQQNADTADYKAKNPNKTFKDANGFLVALDPVDGTGELVRDSSGEPIETGKLDDRTKMDLQLENAKELEGVRQSNRQSLEGTRELNRQKDITSRAAARTSPTAKPETETAKQQRIYNRAIEAINRHPEWRDYIKIDKVRKVVDILEPQGRGGVFGSSIGAKKGGDPKVAAAALKYVYGDEAPAGSTTAKPKEPPVAPKGWKYVAKPGGGWTAVEDK